MEKLSSCALTKRNCRYQDKPNEDYYLCDDKQGIYIIVDGVSRDRKNGIYPNPSPAKKVSEIFAKQVYDYLNSCLDGDLEDCIRNAFIEGNRAIEQYNNKKYWENGFLPGTVGIVAVIKEKVLHFCYIGDCFGCVLNRYEQRIFTTCQTKLIARHKKEFSAQEIRNKICNNIEHVYSYGVLNGDIRALDFVCSGKVNLDGMERIILCTDGFIDVVKELDVDGLYNLDLKKALQVSKDTDDKTMIIIQKGGF